VLVSAGPFQLSQFSSKDRRSLFSEAIEKGFAGAADKDGRQTIELQELFEYVLQEVPKNAKKIASGMQSPLLLHFKDGKAESKADFSLVHYLSPKPQKDAEETAAADKKEKAASSDKAREGSPEAKLAELIRQAWKLCDGIQNRAGKDGGWTPVDYAPHLWRYTREYLLGFEQRSRLGVAYEKNLLREQIESVEDLIDHLNKFETQAEFSASGEDKSFVRYLADARSKFMRSEARIRLDLANESMQVLKNALQTKNDLLFCAPYYVRWHSVASKFANEKLELSGSLRSYLDQLADFCDELEAEFDRSSTSSIDLDRLKAMTDAVRKSGMDLARVIGVPPQSIEMSDASLASPLLSAEERVKLRRIRADLESAPVFADGIEAKSMPEEIPRELRLERILEQWELECRLVVLADPAKGKTMQKKIEDYSSSSQTDKSSLFLELGRDLRDFYAGIPDRIPEKPDSSELDRVSLRAIERLLRLEDARDDNANWLTDVAYASLTSPLPPSPPAIRPTLAVEFEPSSLQIPRLSQSEDSATFSLRLTRTGANEPNEAQVTLTIAPRKLVEIVDLETNKAVDSETSLPVAFGTETEKTLKFRVRTLSGREFDAVKLSAEASMEGVATSSAALKMELAPLEEIELRIYRFGQLVERVRSDLSQQVLAPFPNRATKYKMALVNHGKAERKARVEFYTLANPSNFAGKADLEKPRPLTKIEPIVIDLPVGKEVFLAPQPSAKAPDKSPPENAEKKSESKNGDAKTGQFDDLTAGLLCRIFDNDTNKPIGNEKWIKRNPYKPWKYFKEPEIAVKDGLITIELITLDNPKLLPPISEENPIKIAWRKEKDKEEQGWNFTRPGDRFEFAVPFSKEEMSKENGAVPIRISVDDYPRAFYYKIPSNQNGPINLDGCNFREKHDIRFTWPATGQCLDIIGKKTIPVRFEIDAPEAYLDYNAEKKYFSIAMTPDAVAGEIPGPPIPSSRQVQVRLEDFSSDGEWNVFAKVDDYEVPLNVEKRADCGATIKAEIRVGQTSALLKSDLRRVFLQRSPPVVKEIKLDAPTLSADPLSGYVVLDQVHGDFVNFVEEIRVGFDAGSGKLDDGQDFVVCREPEGKKWHFSGLQTVNLKPASNYKLLAKVVDRCGLVSTKDGKDASIAVTREKHAESSGKPDAPKKTRTVKGRVVDVSSRAVSESNIVLRGNGKTFAAPCDANGNFEIKDVPLGEYEVFAQGKIAGYPSYYEDKITLVESGNPYDLQEIKLDWSGARGR
jgi:hypothetical protein